MSNTPAPTPTPTPVNPAQGILGNIPAGGSTGSSYYTGVPEGYVPPTGRKPKKIKDAKGNEFEVFYSPTLDANVILNSLDPKSRATILSGLATKISGYEPGTGYEDKDKKAFADLLEYANVAGLPYAEAYRDFMQRVPNSSYVKKAPSVRVTSADDLKAVFRKASTDLLGYEVDDATAQSFAQSYRQMEVAEGRKQAAGGVYEAAAAPSTVAEQQILQQFKPEAQSFAAGNYAQIMDARIKELGA